MLKRKKKKNTEKEEEFERHGLGSGVEIETAGDGSYEDLLEKEKNEKRNKESPTEDDLVGY